MVGLHENRGGWESNFFMIPTTIIALTRLSLSPACRYCEASAWIKKEQELKGEPNRWSGEFACMLSMSSDITCGSFQIG